MNLIIYYCTCMFLCVIFFIANDTLGVLLKDQKVGCITMNINIA